MEIFKLFLVAVNAVCIALYVPINQYMTSGVCPKRPIDERVPFVPIFVYPYLFFYFPWMIWLYGSAYFQPLPDLYRLTMATLISVGIGYTCFLFFPTYVECTYPKGKGLTYRLLQLLHHVDKQNNACPSMHVYLAVILTVFSLGQNMLVNAGLVVMGAAIIASTVLTKRHYLADVVGGLLVGGMSCSLAFYLV